MALPLLAIGAGIARFGIGAYQNRRNTRRKKRLIQDAYRNSADRLADRQSDVRQSQDESLAARGLLQGGQERIAQATELNSTDARATRPGDVAAAVAKVDPKSVKAPMDERYYRALPPNKRVMARVKNNAIQRAMMTDVALQGEQFAKPKSAPRSLGAQQQADNEGEFGVEWRDLDQARQSSLDDVKAESNDRTISDIAGGIQTGVAVHSAGKALAAGQGVDGGDMLSALSTAIPAGTQVQNTRPAMPQLSPIVRAAMTGVEDPGNWFGGINGLNPLGAEGSSWNRGGTMIGAGQTNAEFHV